jgi:hypothetical protein
MKYIITVILFLAIILMFGMITFMPNERVHYFETKTNVYKPIDYYQRLEINEQAYNIEKARNFFLQYGENRIMKIIVYYSFLYEIPITLSISLAMVESNLDEYAYNKNSNGSYDKGLFQLNNYYRKEWTDDMFYNAEINTKDALRFLKSKYDYSGSWEIALTLYNSGSYKNTGEHSLKHMAKILDKEEEIEKTFNEFYRNTNITKL